jgi:DNA processing protein
MALQDRRNLIPFKVLYRMNRDAIDLDTIWYSNPKELRKIGFTSTQAKKLREYIDSVQLSKYGVISEQMEASNTRIITYFDEEYPLRLKTQPPHALRPPLILYIRGTMPNLDKCISIVGTRNASDNSKAIARNFASELASEGYTIVSGLAYGIDYEAHMGALGVKNGKTISVLVAIDPIYPQKHIELSNQIIKNGCIVSETYLGPIRKYSFLKRNRIISGISESIIAVESGPTGGTIEQVKIALSQKKPVFTLAPDKTTNKEKKLGYEKMIRLGAKPIQSIQEIQKKVITRQSTLF